MGWYSALGRPLFNALPPESAHRVALAALALPLPWRRIGGAVEDPSIEVTLAGIRLRNPIGLAAGFDKSCRHLASLGALGFGFVVGGSLTRAPREGNAKPRIARYPERRSMTNAMGLPNPGAGSAAANLAKGRRTAPRFASVADEAVEDAVAAMELVEPLVDGIELNASCPNVSWGRDRDNEAHLRELVTAFRRRTGKPIFVKVPPFREGTEQDVVLALAAIAQESGADGIVGANTRPVGDTRLAVGSGGVSGLALWERTPSIVAALRKATQAELPIVACGGIFSAEDVLACLLAGATAVQVYTALVQEGPGLPGVLTRGLLAEARGGGLALSDVAETAKPDA